MLSHVLVQNLCYFWYVLDLSDRYIWIDDLRGRQFFPLDFGILRFKDHARRKVWLVEHLLQRRLGSRGVCENIRLWHFFFLLHTLKSLVELGFLLDFFFDQDIPLFDVVVDFLMCRLSMFGYFFSRAVTCFCTFSCSDHLCLAMLPFLLSSTLMLRYHLPLFLVEFIILGDLNISIDFDHFGIRLPIENKYILSIQRRLLRIPLFDPRHD